MEKRPIFVLLGLLAAAGALAEAYTWTDADGIVHYSDRPEPGARVIDLGTKDHARPSPATRPSAGSTDSDTNSAEPEPATGYTSIEIASPAAEETLWNIAGTLNVSIALSPTLRPGHQVRLYFDGAPQPVSGTNVTLQEVWRGVHNLQAEVVDETGKLVVRSRPSRFYVQQNTVLR
jgi:hypothetical protein